MKQIAASFLVAFAATALFAAEPAQDTLIAHRGESADAAEKGLKTLFKIDYFATSLPLLLIFEDDLEAVKNARMENLKSLVEKGLAMCGDEVKHSPRPFGFSKHGDEAFAYVLKGKGGLELEFSNIGGRVVSLLVPGKDGRRIDVTVGFDDISGWEKTDPYFGAIIGRVCNRIADGKFTLDGIAYDVGRNDAKNNASLHGGASDGLRRRY